MLPYYETGLWCELCGAPADIPVTMKIPRAPVLCGRHWDAYEDGHVAVIIDEAKKEVYVYERRAG